MWGPLEDGEEILKGEDEFGGQSLVFKGMKRVVREEDFREPVFEFLEGGLLRRETNLVDFHGRRWDVSLDFDDSCWVV